MKVCEQTFIDSNLDRRQTPFQSFSFFMDELSTGVEEKSFCKPFTKRIFLNHLENLCWGRDTRKKFTSCLANELVLMMSS